MSEDMAMGLQRYLSYLSGQYSVTATPGVASLGGIGGSPLGTARNFEMVQKSRQRGATKERWIPDPKKPGGGYLNVEMDVIDEDYYELVETLVPGGGQGNKPQTPAEIITETVTAALNFLKSDTPQGKKCREALGYERIMVDDFGRVSSIWKVDAVNVLESIWSKGKIRNDNLDAVAYVPPLGGEIVVDNKWFIDPKKAMTTFLGPGGGVYTVKNVKQGRLFILLHELAHATGKYTHTLSHLLIGYQRQVTEEDLNQIIYDNCFREPEKPTDKIGR